jgi:hypothetical protein
VSIFSTVIFTDVSFPCQSTASKLPPISSLLKAGTFLVSVFWADVGIAISKELKSRIFVMVHVLYF